MDNKREKFKEILRYIESSGADNPIHPRIEEGIHAGDSAIGKYALMPSTVDYILNAEKRDTGVDSPYAHLKGSSSESLKKAFDQDKDIPQSLKRTSEGLEEYLVNKYADTVLKKHPDLIDAQAAWNLGHNVSQEDIDFAEKNYPIMKGRAEKAREILEKDTPKRQPNSEKLPPYIPNILDLLKFNK